MKRILAINYSKENNSFLKELHTLANMKHKLNPQPSRLVIARNIKALREHGNLSQAALAKRAGVSQRTVSNIENPKSETTPTTDRVEAVAAAFGLQLFHVAMPIPLDILIDIGGLNRMIDTYATIGPTKRETVERIAKLALPDPER
ncbi:MAG TPA: helix-turn-helix transcriptional regulator [Candidatus Competibacteraceae bacterium]|nr:helix-turn-helix transcriptional regulator [Candidatus Competibacteraceae bacterium]